MRSKLLIALGLTFAVFAGAATNTVSSGSTAIVLPAVVPAYSPTAPTNRVEVMGALVREHGIIRQKTANGWEICPRERRFVIVQFMSGSGTAIVRDSGGDLARLSSACTALILTGSDTLSSQLYVHAEGGDVTVFSSQR